MRKAHTWTIGLPHLDLPSSKEEKMHINNSIVTKIDICINSAVFNLFLIAPNFGSGLQPPHSSSQLTMTVFLSVAISN